MKQITFGRASDCDIIFNDKSISRHHGCLLVVGKNVYVTDNNSLNGIYVNEKRIQDTVLLSPTDKILIAKKIPMNWRDYIDIDELTIGNNAETLIINSPSHNPSQYCSHSDEKALINIPSRIEINQNYNHAEVYRNGNDGADWKVPFKRNVGEKVGNAIGSVLGLIVSIVIFMAVLGLLYFLFSSIM